VTLGTADGMGLVTLGVADGMVLCADTNQTYHDDLCVVTFIQGCIFRVLERHDEAEKAFLDVIERYTVCMLFKIYSWIIVKLYTVPACA
jgi:hypothetical protein